MKVILLIKFNEMHYFIKKLLSDYSNSNLTAFNYIINIKFLMLSPIINDHFV